METDSEKLLKGLEGKVCYVEVGDKVTYGFIQEYKPYFRHPTDHMQNEPAQFIVHIDKDTPRAFRIADVTVPITGDDIPQVWWEILGRQPLEVQRAIGVCRSFHSEPGSTTLFDPKTLERLRVVSSSWEEGNVKLWPGDEQPTEGKLELVDGDTEYKVGDIVIDMEAEHYQ